MHANALGTRYSISEAARLLHVHTATVWRWVLHGVRGRKLRSVLIGGRRYVLSQDLEEFLAVGNDPLLGENCMRRRADEAGKVLDVLGVTPKVERRRQ